VPVGADFIDWPYVADVFAIEITSIASVTARTVLRVNFVACALSCALIVNGYLGGSFVRAIALRARVASVDCGRDAPSAECCALVAAPPSTVIAVPMRVKVFCLRGPCSQMDGKSKGQPARSF